jgi:hypothetical protein
VPGGSSGNGGAGNGGQIGGGTGGAGGESATGGAGGVPAPRLFVDPVHGSDSANDACSEAAPCRTLKHTLPLAKSGYFVELAPGVYGVSSGEDFSAPVPDGVTLESVTTASVTLLGDAARTKTALTFAGSGAVRDLTIDSFAQAIAASTGTVTLEEVTVTRCATGLALKDQAEATLTNSSISDTALGFSLIDFARLSITEGTISGTGPNCGLGAVGSVTGQAELELSSVTVKDNLGGLYLGGASTTSIADSTFSNNAFGSTGCADDYHILVNGASSLTLDKTIISGGRGGIATVGEVSVSGGRIYGGQGDGIDVRAGVTRIDGTALVSGLNFGFFGLWLLGGSAEVHNATFSQWDGAIRFQSQSSLLVRNTELSANRYGVIVTILFTPGPDTFDLGTALAPGGNTIRGNEYGLYVYTDGGALRAPWVIQAVGNTWDPSVQGSDADGHMLRGSIISGPYTALGTNFFVGCDLVTVQF